jgi:hypothetical protein
MNKVKVGDTVSISRDIGIVKVIKGDTMGISFSNPKVNWEYSKDGNAYFGINRVFFTIIKQPKNHLPKWF